MCNPTNPNNPTGQCSGCAPKRYASPKGRRQLTKTEHDLYLNLAEKCYAVNSSYYSNCIHPFIPEHLLATLHSYKDVDSWVSTGINRAELSMWFILLVANAEKESPISYLSQQNPTTPLQKP